MINDIHARYKETQSLLQQPSTKKVDPSATSIRSKALPLPQGTDDNVTITPKAGQLARMQQSLDNLPDIDVHKINAIKSALTQGRYHINSNAIAERIIAVQKE